MFVRSRFLNFIFIDRANWLANEEARQSCTCVCVFRVLGTDRANRLANENTSVSSAAKNRERVCLCLQLAPTALNRLTNDMTSCLGDRGQKTQAKAPNEFVCVLVCVRQCGLSFERGSTLVESHIVAALLLPIRLFSFPMTSKMNGMTIFTKSSIWMFDGSSSSFRDLLPYFLRYGIPLALVLCVCQVWRVVRSFRACCG